MKTSQSLVMTFRPTNRLVTWACVPLLLAVAIWVDTSVGAFAVVAGVSLRPSSLPAGRGPARASRRLASGGLKRWSMAAGQTGKVAPTERCALQWQDCGPVIQAAATSPTHCANHLPPGRAPPLA